MPSAASGARTADAQRSGRQVLERLCELPGGAELLRATRRRNDAELIGGATRDLLLGGRPRELDVVLDRGAEELALELVSLLAGSSAEGSDGARIEHRVHDRFGTALVTWSAGRIDIATRRAESYALPGALPDVRCGSAEDDLRRRDFTVNAIAVSLAGEREGQLRAPAPALEDLRAGRLRILHERSFIDDPTRLMRLARYRARLGFEPEHRTAELAARALADGALQTVSPARLGAELRLALREPDPLAALRSLAQLGVLAGLRPPLGLDESLARRALRLLPGDGRVEVLLLACLLLGLAGGAQPGIHTSPSGEAGLVRLLDRFEFPAVERDAAVHSAYQADQLAQRLSGAPSGSALREAVRGAPLEGITLAGALAEQQGSAQAASAAQRWLGELRHVSLQINGDDLLAAGLTAGPEIGRRLEHVLQRRLDGEVGNSREAQLQAALEDAR